MSIRNRFFSTLILVAACGLLGACSQPATSAAPAAPTAPRLLSAVPSPTVDPITLNICATCDVQQRRVQATAAAAE